MNKEIATKVFESLASGIRLDVWRLLVKAGLASRGFAGNTLRRPLKAASTTQARTFVALLEEAGL